MRVAILSRGYGHTGGINDEGRVLEENLPDVPHLQNPDRVALAQVAVLELETELIVLDDGFQHRRLARDLDVVLLDALEPFGLSQLFPRGLASRAGSIAQRARRSSCFHEPTWSPMPDRAAIRAEAERQAGSLNWVEAAACAARPGRLRRAKHFRSASSRGNPSWHFAGSATPRAFAALCSALCGELIDFRVFPDHHPYTARMSATLERWVDALGSQSRLDHAKGFGQAAQPR